jgi:hypothetical protein
MLDKYKLLLALLLLLLVGGCANPSWTTAGKIVPPVYEVCPLEGKWAVIEDLGSEGYSGTNLGVDSSLQFGREVAILGSNIWNKPTYKIKKVNSTDYFMTRYITLDSYLTSISQEADVVTVFAESNFLGEFMKLDDATVIAFVQNKVLLLHKIADHADDPLTVPNAKIADDSQYDNTGTSGVFIGLKIPSKTGYSYKTVWIAADDKKLRPVLSRNELYFPRKSGFWELQVKSGLKPGESAAGLSAHNMAVKNSAAASDQVAVPTASPGTQSIGIDYVGNDYVTISNNIGGISKLQVLPVDKLSPSIGMKVSDLLGAAGLTAYQSAREQALQALNGQGITLIDEDVNEDDFGLIRKNGHWHLQGRINYQSNGIPATTDFNINFIPPANLIFYDTLNLSWQSVKDRVPNALDAFTSPNKDIAVIKTKSKLYFFGISGEQLDSVPLGEIELKDGTTVIMAEWATGFYVDNWESTFVANGAHVVDKSGL